MAMTQDDIKQLMVKLESLGEPKVRQLVIQGELGGPGSRDGDQVEGWLRLQESQRDLESMSMAREAMRIAREQRTIAVVATIMATIATMTAIAAMIISLMK